MALQKTVLVFCLAASLCCAQEPSNSALLEQLDQHIRGAVEEEAFSGTVLLARNGRPFFKEAYGLASKRFGVANKIDTKFNLGSMNKMFTTVGIAQLVEQKKLAFDDPIGKHLGENWISAENGKKVTIRHLLTHTSGLGSFFNREFMRSSKELFRSVDDYRPLIDQESLQFEPGADWSYSNTGFILLGAIIEKTSGKDYFDYIRDHIYRLAGMINSDCYDMDLPVPNLAIGYGKTKSSDGTERWENNFYKHDIKGSPAGGGFSTVEDLLKFDVALRSHKLIKQETWRLLTTITPNTGRGQDKWGLGFILRDDEKLGRVAGHGGGFFGINSVLDMYLENGFTVAVMSNYSQGVGAISGKIRDTLISLKNQQMN